LRCSITKLANALRAGVNLTYIISKEKEGIVPSLLYVEGNGRRSLGMLHVAVNASMY
jgi:hypothetical protein